MNLYQIILFAVTGLIVWSVLFAIIIVIPSRGKL